MYTLLDIRNNVHLLGEETHARAQDLAHRVQVIGDWYADFANIFHLPLPQFITVEKLEVDAPAPKAPPPNVAMASSPQVPDEDDKGKQVQTLRVMDTKMEDRKATRLPMASERAPDSSSEPPLRRQHVDSSCGVEET